MTTADFSVARPTQGELLVRLSGAWQMSGRLPDAAEIEHALASDGTRRIAFDATDLGAWDTGLLVFLSRIADTAAKRGIPMDRSGLPTGVQRLLALSEAVPERSGARSTSAPPTFLARVGRAALNGAESARAFVGFIGQLTLAFGALIRRRARFRWSDLLLFVQQASADALPIVTLISFLVGVILSFVGAIQLEKFGASIYVADLVGIGIVHDMGALMTGIIMAGRTGAAFAAQLGTMKVTQEIDALTTMGIDPLEFLVLPRAVALSLMMPLLCLYADLVGILGGAVIAAGMLGIGPPVYFGELFQAVRLSDLFGGVFKAAVYGVLIAVAGCLRGMQSGNSASAVGDAATSAVVTGIVLIVSACGVFAVVFYVLGI
ncbi:MAG: MlaE family ABC transporter permease [Candidatus Binatia bacterium]